MTSPFDDFIFDPSGTVVQPPTPDEEQLFLQNKTVDLDEYAQSPEAREAGLMDYFQDLVVQGGRGVARAFTYPADLLKLAMMGEALTDLDELEMAYHKAGVPFDKDEYIKNVFKQSEFVPTQDLLENFIQENTPLDLEPVTPLGKRINQFFTILTFARGSGLARAAGAGATAAATSELLEQAGAPEVVADIAGDVAGLSTTAIGKTIPRVFEAEVEELAEIADRLNLPFWEGVAQPAAKAQRPKIFNSTAEALEREFGESVESAVKAIAEDRLPVARLREAGVNLEELNTHALERVSEIAAGVEQQISVEPVVRGIRSMRKRILARAPSPSDADRAVLEMLDREERALLGRPDNKRIDEAIERINKAPDILVDDVPVVQMEGRILPKEEALGILERQKAQTAPKNVSATQFINQYRNWNANLKSIYRRPEFSGREDGIRKAYEEIKQLGVASMDAEGPPELAEALRQSNNIYRQTKQLDQFEGILGKTMDDGIFNPKKLQRLLDGRDGKFLQRIIGEEGISDLKDIARLGRKANERVLAFAEKKGGGFLERLGPLAPLMFTSGTVGAIGKVGLGLAPYARGWALTKPATREAYLGIMKAAAQGNMEALPAHFETIYDAIDKEFGSFDAFIEQGLDGLEIWTPQASDEASSPA